jgi:hypothetical protein
MKKKFNPFQFKVIETKYNGYRFRSRLEARWAVFFDALGIRYEYEKEGYDLEGTWYLPDFWFPEHDCFIEIKGQEPTDEEVEKARLLSLYAQKEVSLFYGNIQPPTAPLSSFNSYFIRSATLWTYDKNQGAVGNPSTTRVNAPSYILALLQRLESARIDLSVNRFGELTICSNPISYSTNNLDEYLSYLEEQQETLQTVQKVLEEHAEEIRCTLTTENGWELEFFSQSPDIEEVSIWGECGTCGAFQLRPSFLHEHTCNETTTGKLDYNSPRLMAAYEAARQARF